MQKHLLSALALALALSGGLQAAKDDHGHDHSHGGHGHSHAETGTFEPPHGGAFAKLADHWIEFYLDGGKAYLCMFEPDGKPTEDQHTPKQIVLKLSGKGMKAATLKATTAVGGCASWDFKTGAKLVRAQVEALVDGKPAKAKLNLENRPKKKPKP
jgi:hypothetical protein